MRDSRNLARLACLVGLTAFGPVCANAGEILLSDFSAVPRPSDWRAIPYETKDGIRGSLLFAPWGAEPCRRVEIALPARGHYRIFLGLCGTRYLIAGRGFEALVRLSRDPAPVVMDAVAETADAGWWFQPVENEWKTADLDGDKLIFENRRGFRAALAWIRLVPVGPEGKSARLHDMIATNDAYEPFDSMDEMLAPIMRMKDGPVREIHYNCGNGAYSFHAPSAVAISSEWMPGAVYEDPYARDCAESYGRFRRERPQLLRELVDFAHAQGMKFMVSFRTGCTVDLMRLSEMTGRTRPGRDGFDIVSRENMCELFDGTKVARFSYAKKEVRNWFLKFYAEMLASGADGLSLVWIRALPAMLFEPAFRDRFRRVYGEELEDEGDVRVRTLRAEILTEFHRRVRGLLGKRRFTVFVPPDAATCADFGLDLRRLAQEGIVDEFVVGSTKQTPNHDESFSSIDFGFFRAVCAGTHATFRTCFWGGAHCYVTSVAEGASGVAYWDAATKPWRQWEEVRLLDDCDGEKAKAWRAANPPASRVHPFKTLDGFDHAVYPYHVAY